MERKFAADRAPADNGCCAIHWEILWKEVRILGSVICMPCPVHQASADVVFIGWAKYMEWKYPVEVVITSPGEFKVAGAIEAAAAL